MTVKDIILTSATFLGREDIISYLNGDEVSQVSLNIEKEISILVRLLNIVVSEIATDFVPIKTIETARSNNGQILFSSLLETPLDILNVYDVYSNKINFSLTPLYIKTKPESVKVEYTYIPQPLSLTSPFPYSEKQLPSRVFAYGVAYNTCLFEGKFDEADLWEKKYREALALVVLPKSSSVKGRWWR